MEQVIVVHYSEIALKGENRRWFEDCLAGNIRRILERLRLPGKVSKESGRIVISNLRKSRFLRLKEALGFMPGVANFGVGVRTERSIRKITEATTSLAKNFSGSFKIDARRSDKSYRLTSQELNERLGATVAEKHKLKVNLSEPENIIWVEVTKKSAYVYSERHEGIGGLPVGTGGRAIVLISAGFDSPVASYLMLKRGLKLDFIHFHSYPYVSKNSIEQVKRLVKRLSDFGGESKLILFPFAEIQKEIIAKAPEAMRVILYRRAMFRIADAVARRGKREALVTGESVGQVASQTLRNIRIIEEAATLPVLRPLLGFNKEEIVKLARKIGTYEISAEPYDDCCSFMMPRRVLTWADPEEIRKAEKKLNFERLRPARLSAKSGDGFINREEYIII